MKWNKKKNIKEIRKKDEQEIYCYFSRGFRAAHYFVLTLSIDSQCTPFY